MQLLEATVQRSHLITSVSQELNKQQVLHSELIEAAKQANIAAYAKNNGLELQVTPPIYVAGHRKGR
jgi:hypothetical protein